MSELIEARRKAFEAWARDTFYSGLACPSDTWSESRTMYNDPAHHMAFKAWQAALDSVVVELPKIVNSEWACTSDECAAMRDAIRFCKHAIHAAGIKTEVKV
ncbi:MAG: hypothetical protein CMK71_02805 [Pseudomonadaceae bacterium]|nr:hypothetical protein [Pseudomonadaceae bacterium]|tara:strand:- start:577 stop:882 length:306 start_codon:yes stop_codon:yes gene_type:complete